MRVARNLIDKGGEALQAACNNIKVSLSIINYEVRELRHLEAEHGGCISLP